MNPHRRFMPSDTDRARIPVVIISGFLGSGKTTLINGLLRDPRLSQTAVAVNEIGAEALDQHLIEGGDKKPLVLGNGCLCCNLGQDAEGAILKLFAGRDRADYPLFSRMLIEPSGMADPAPIAQAILRNPLLSTFLRLESIIAVVDAQFALGQIDRHPEARKQIWLADQIVLTKTELAGAAGAAACSTRLRELNPLATIHQIVPGATETENLLPQGFIDPQQGSTLSGIVHSRLFSQPAGTAAPHSSGIEIATLTADQPLQWRRFETWLRNLRIAHAERLLRIKGVIDIAGLAAPIAIHGVQHVLHDPVALASWPSGARRSRLVLTAQDLALAPIRQDWAAALSGMYATAELERI
jgi:G3E family GTPase